VVDDNPSALELLTERLTSFTFDVTPTLNADDALKLLSEAERNENKPYRLVLMDWRMPGLNGIEAGRLIKQNKDQLSVVPAVILITAYGREEVMLQAESAGLDAILIKPVSPSVLFDTVIRVLNHEEAFESIQVSGTTPTQRLSGTVLLVEDNIINQQVAQEILEGMGLLVYTVSNGVKAIEALSQHSYDLVLMDLQMPEMDGYEATRRIRADARYKQLPLIAMTAHAMAEEREQCLAVGMNEHLPKPIDPAQLHKLLCRYLKPAETGVSQTAPRHSQLQDNDLPTNLPTIDLRWGLERVGGNTQLYLNLLAEFVTNHTQDLAALETDLQHGHIDSARRTLHTLEGVSGNIGAHTLQQASKELHKTLAKGEVSPLTLPSDDFRQAFTGLINELRGYLTKSTLPIDSPLSDTTLKPVATAIESDRLIASLDDMLAAGNPEAKELFKTLQQMLKHQDSAELSARLAKQIREYDFDLARETLATLSEHVRNR
jgi:polar amino acid transport system substrate-binding protein